MSDDLVKRLRAMVPAGPFAPTATFAPHRGANRIEALEDEKMRLRGALLDTAAHLSAALSLLEKDGRNGACSDKVFSIMFSDYRDALENARTTLKETAEGTDK